MATGKQGFVRASESQHSVSVQREKEMHVQASLPAMYIQAASSVPAYPQAQPAAVQDSAVIPLSLQMMYANQAFPFLTLQIASGAGLQQQRPEPSASSSRPKSAGKHVCPHCGRDCLKPSVLEKHLRCHTGERPYPCSTCGISFKTQSNLYKHKRTQAHARLSSESGKGTFSSQESTESSRENCSSPSLELQNEDSEDTNRNDGVLPVVPTSTACSEVKTGSETEWALCKAAVVGVIASPAHGQQVISHTQRGPQFSPDAAPIKPKSSSGDGRAPLTPNRTPLQRQEALFPKSQSHDSTDSGFSESSEHHSTASPGIPEHNPSMELEEPETSEKPSEVGSDDVKGKVSLQEKQKLEEHILKLISKNSVVIDDKDLVNVRPRKTVLSKQGSIDLPMQYTYKDSFHFEIKSNKHPVCQKQDRNGRAFYCSMPSQHSTSLEHAPLTRSSSLPFSVGIPNCDSTVSPYPADNVPLSRRCSAGQIYPCKSVDQHTPNHRSLVRQVAVDGLSAAEGSPLDRGSLSSLSSDGDSIDTASAPAGKGCRRKKAQKFAYNKWYMYGGGTFKKLYSTEKDSVLKSRKSTLSSEQTDSQGIQMNQQKDSNSSASISASYTSYSDLSSSPVPNVLTAQASSLQSSLLPAQNTPMKQSKSKQANVPSSDLGTVMNAIKGTEEKGRAPEAQHLSTPIPSERKKQKTDGHLSAFVENPETLIRVHHCASRQVNTNLCQSLPLQSSDLPPKSASPQGDNGSSLNRQGSFTNLSSSSNQRQLLFKRHSSPLFAANMTGTSASPSVSSSISSVAQAKTSFLPKYQLKIPVLTDGMSDPCLAKVSSLNQSSPRQNVSLNQQTATTSPSATQNHSAMATGQEQNSLRISAVTNASTTTSHAHSCQDANAYTSTKSVSLASPLAFTEQNFTVSTCSVSLVSPSSPSKNSHVYVGNVPSVQDNPVTSIMISKPGVTPGPVLPSSTDGIPLGMSSTEIQGSQDTFYMQTADLQIVMQLISDEQLALIEPHIETQNYKNNVNHCHLSKETSAAPTGQTCASQEINIQGSSDTGTTLAAEHGNVNMGVLSNIPDISLMPLGLTVTEHKVTTATSGTKGIISSSPSKAEHDVPPFLDSAGLGQQCKVLGPTPEDSTVPEDQGTAGFASSSRPYIKQMHTRNLNKNSANNSTAKNQTPVSKSSVHDQTLRNYSTSIMCGSQQNQDPTGRPSLIQTIVTPTKNAVTYSEGKAAKGKHATFPEISEISPNPPSANTSIISVASPVLALNQDEPKSCQASGSSLALARVSSSVSVLACRGCPQKPLDQSGDRLNHEEHKSRQHLPRSGAEEIKTIASRHDHVTSTQFESNGSLSNCLKEDTIKCALGPGEMLHVSQDQFTGPRVSCSLQSLKFQWEPGTATRHPWIPLESKSGGGGDRTERAGTWDTKSTWTKQEEESMENKKEAANCTESYHIAVKPHPDLSTSQSMTIHDVPAASPELISISTTSAICGITNPSHESKCPGKDHVRESSPSANGPSLQPDRTSTNVKEHASLGHADSFPLSSKTPGDVRHLLAHPLLVNAIQKEVQKETRTKNSALRLTHSTSSRAQKPAPERETDGRVRIGMPEEHCVTAACTKEHCQIIKTTPAYTPRSCSNQTNTSCIHPNPTCTSGTQSIPSEPNPPHGYIEEEEERSSSSDDEGKLVIELE